MCSIKPLRISNYIYQGDPFIQPSDHIPQCMTSCAKNKNTYQVSNEAKWKSSEKGKRNKIIKYEYSSCALGSCSIYALQFMWWIFFQSKQWNYNGHFISSTITNNTNKNSRYKLSTDITQICINCKLIGMISCIQSSNWTYWKSFQEVFCKVGTFFCKRTSSHFTFNHMRLHVHFCTDSISSFFFQKMLTSRKSKLTSIFIERLFLSLFMI